MAIITALPQAIAANIHDGDVVAFEGFTHLIPFAVAYELTLIYESGTIRTRPQVLPLSIGDGELCETALTTVSVPEMFRYWLQGGRVSGGGGAPEIAAQRGEVFITMPMSTRSFVKQLPFITSFGHGFGGNHRPLRLSRRAQLQRLRRHSGAAQYGPRNPAAELPS